MKLQVNEKQLEEMEARMDAMTTNQQIQNTHATQSVMDSQNENVGIIKEQLDLGEDLLRIDYLLRGYTIEIIDGVSSWVKPTDETMEVLSEYGVHLIRNTIAWYMNKNTLLSNYYEEEMIRNKMEDFAEALNDAVFMEYDKVFKYPTFEKCQEVFMERLEKRAKLKQFAQEILGKKVDLRDVKSNMLKQFEDGLEIELDKIKQTLMKNKLKRFELLIRVVQDAVHSTYLRSYRGEERRSLRKNIHVSENTGGMSMPQQQSSWLNMFKK